MALLILAGLQLISADVYEAAQIDGASKWQTFSRITIPLIKVPLMVAVLFRTLDVLRIYDLPAILTGGGGGSGHATTSLSILVINQIRGRFQQRLSAVDHRVPAHCLRGLHLRQVPRRGRRTRPPGKGKAERRLLRRSPETAGRSQRRLAEGSSR